MKRRYNHIPIHLRPPKIPKLRMQDKNTLPNILKRYLFMIAGIILLPLVGLDADELYNDELDE